EAVDGSCGSGEFEIVCDDGSRLRSRKILLATGILDILPEIEGLKELYGRSVHHCPYCDGWEHRDQRLAALGRGNAGAGLALSLRTWSHTITACTEGKAPAPDHIERLRRAGIALREQRVRRVEGEAGRLKRIIF